MTEGGSDWRVGGGGVVLGRRGEMGEAECVGRDFGRFQRN